MNKSQLRTDIEMAINRNSAENGSDTPDFILAEYLMDCLETFDKAINQRGKWYNHHCRIGSCNHLDTKEVVLPPVESKVEVASDSPSLSLFICKTCGETFKEYGCREDVCHAPPKLSDRTTEEATNNP